MSLASWFRNLLSPRPKGGPELELGRNDICWCGSGKKYKKCHLKSDELKRAEANYSAQVTARNRMGDGVMPGKAKPRKLEKAAEPPVKG
ncbi:MAG TPA: SEC-C metal-binding domain-containing protein [Thermoanaerobaculia bacterium]|nr:SEC-C metal-binding domain-containing protein [Thermoanaerobaculia bacterium]